MAAIGGEAVAAEALVAGPENPHRPRTRAGMVRKLHGAQLLVVNGLELESGWLPGVVRAARNPAFGPGGSARIDASEAVTPLDVPRAATGPASGGSHPAGNPHYLADPVNGLRVAAFLEERLAARWPERAAEFAAGAAVFRRDLITATVGEALVARHGVDVLAARLDTENLMDLLEDSDAPGGWLGALAPYAGTRVAEDHAHWRYFARRFGLVIAATLQPQPGVPPTDEQVAAFDADLRAQRVPLLLWCVFVDERNARGAAERTDARMVAMSHQAGSRTGADGYIGSLDFDVRSLAGALR